MNLTEWCNLDEQIYMAQGNEQYNQYAGLPHSENVMKTLAELRVLNTKIFLQEFREPRRLLLSSLESMADAEAKELELEMFRLRNTEVKSDEQEFNGKPVNWSSWRQFNAAESDWRKRKQVYDELMSKSSAITKVIASRFRKMKETYNRYGLDPLDSYLENEGLTERQLVELVMKLGASVRKSFSEKLHEFAREILGREAEYFDDFYFFRNKVYAPLDLIFKKVNPLQEVKKTLRDLGFDESRIRFDTEDRQNKYPSPICFFVHVPNDIRVLYKTESPYFDLGACFHETGHAAHATSIDPGLEYWNRYGFSMGVAEIFSIFLENIVSEPRFLSRRLGLRQEEADDLLRRKTFMEMFFLTFYTANSLMKIEFWRKGLTMEQADEVYGKLALEYTGLEIPGRYWQLHHILPEFIMYVPSYMIAAVRAVELAEKLRDEFGEEWWNTKGAGEYLRDIMRPGALIDTSKFSKLDTATYLKQILVNA